MVSIIVPVYNAENYIETTIDMVRAQSWKDWELILVDDCSKDASVSIIEKYIERTGDQRIKLISKKENAGAAEARNTGVDAATGRYIAFLDADDLWYKEKLTKELQYMEKHDCGFVFSAYDFGDEDGVPVGKVVHVPQTLNYKQALKKTIIFTSTVLFDTEKVDKALIHMPNVASEDSATWWQILKTGIVAYGLNEPLVIYRRPKKSLSSNKKAAVGRIWNLYRNVEHLNVIYAIYCMFCWAWLASVRRLVSDVIWRYLEALKRFTVVQLSLVGMIGQTALYAYAWFKVYYPELTQVRISQDGYMFGNGLKLYFRGHLLILLIYFVLLVFLARAGNGMKTGYEKPGSIIVAQVIALAVTNVVTYFQLSLMRNWLLPVVPMAKLILVQIALAILWAFACDIFYRNVFPPRDILVVRGSGAGDEMSVIDAFNSRQDRYNIVKEISTDLDLETIKKECLYWYGAVILTEMDSSMREQLMEFCYSHFIRIFFVPSISDLMVYSSGRLEIFDTPVLEIKEYGISWERRAVKGVIDGVLALVLSVLTLPWVVLRALKAKSSCGQTFIWDDYAGRNGSTIKIARFADRENSCWPLMLWSVIKWKVSLVGPEPVRKEKMAQLLKQDSRYQYKLRVNPGITGLRREKDGIESEEQIKLDMMYIQRYSLGNDVRLLMNAVFKRKKK